VIDGFMSIRCEEGVLGIPGGDTSRIGIRGSCKCGRMRGRNKDSPVGVRAVLLSAGGVGVRLVDGGMLPAPWTARASTNICGSLSMRRSWSSRLFLSILSRSSHLSLSIIAIISIVLSIISPNPSIDRCSLRSNSCSASSVVNTRVSSPLAGSFPLDRDVDPMLLRGSTEGLWRYVGGPILGFSSPGRVVDRVARCPGAGVPLPAMDGCLLFLLACTPRLEVVSGESATARSSGGRNLLSS
jgi:hypothetical protein